MADTVGTAVVKLQADITDLKKGMADGTNVIKGFGLSATAAVAAAGAAAAAAIGVFLKASIQSAAQAETAQNRLGIALKNVGESSRAALQDHLEYAKALQRTTAFSDEEVSAALTMGLQFNKTGSELKRLTALAADMAAATGGTLQEAMSTLTQATLGNYRGLRQYGVTIDESIKKTQGFAIAQEELSLKFKGAAAQELKTYAGQMKALSNQWDEVKELIGGFLIPHMTKWMGQLKTVIEDGLPLLVKNIKMFGVAAEIALLQAINKFGIFDGKIAQLRKHLDEMSREQIVHDKLEITSDEKANDAKIKARLRLLEIKKGAAITEAKMDAWLADKGKEIRDRAEKEEEKRAREFAEHNRSYSDALRRKIEDDTRSWGDFFANMTFSIRDQFAASVAAMIVHGGRFKDVMKSLGQNILQTFIEEVIKRMVTQWIMAITAMNVVGGGLQAPGLAGAGGFPGGALGAGGAAPGGAAGWGAVGLAGYGAAELSKWGESLGGATGGILTSAIGYQINLAKKLISSPGKTINNAVNSVKKIGKKLFSGGILKEPTLLMGTKSGQMGLAGEEGPEALMSFKDMGLTPTAGRNRLLGGGRPGGGGGGGGDVHIHINGSFLEGDEAKWQKLVRNTLVPEIRKWSDSHNKGPFLKTRGART